MLLAGLAGLADADTDADFDEALSDQAGTTAGSSRSVRDGLYTESQALRGEEIYPGPCGRCHGYKLDGAPDDPDMFPTQPIAGPKFLRNWEGRSLAGLFVYIRTTMPANNPGYLSDQEIADLIAYALYVSDLPAGSRELTADVAELSEILITR